MATSQPRRPRRTGGASSQGHLESYGEPTTRARCASANCARMALLLDSNAPRASPLRVESRLELVHTLAHCLHPVHHAVAVALFDTPPVRLDKFIRVPAQSGCVCVLVREVESGAILCPWRMPGRTHHRRLAARNAFFLASLGASSSTPMISNFSALPLRVPGARDPPRSTGIHGMSSKEISGPVVCGSSCGLVTTDAACVQMQGPKSC